VDTGDRAGGAQAEARVARIRAALERELAPRALVITDDSARHAGHPGAREGGHFRVRIVSERFRGQPALARHRLVFAALDELMGRDIHALNVEAHTPEESTF
jgi:BolA protein